jgi:ElaB/YqjD/DUF883 family membrane-anchored ribosome-binding protein
METNMADANGRSVDDIKRETEATRARLTNTVDELRSTVTDTVADIKQHLSPAAVKAEVGSYVRNRGETIMQDITDAARRNPMQAVAIGVGVAYPLLKIVRSIPLPLAVIGAGYFLASSEKGRAFSERATDMMSDAAGQARDQIDSLREQATQTMSAARDSVGDSVSSLKESMPFGGNGASTTRSASDTLNASYDSVSSASRDTMRSAQRSFDSAQDQALHATRRAFDSAQDQARYATQRATETIRHNPFLVAGAGLLIGGLIASVIPKAQIEDDLMGDASTGLKERAQQAAAQGFEQVKDKAGEILSRVTDAAESEGLSTGGASDAMSDIQQRLQRVAERGKDAAFGRDDTNADKTHQAKEGNHNG